MRFTLQSLVFVLLCTSCSPSDPEVSLPRVDEAQTLEEGTGHLLITVTRDARFFADAKPLSWGDLRNRVGVWKERRALSSDTSSQIVLRADHRLDMDDFRELLKLVVSEPHAIYELRFVCDSPDSSGPLSVMPCRIVRDNGFESGSSRDLHVLIRRLRGVTSNADWEWNEDEVEIRTMHQKLEGVDVLRDLLDESGFPQDSSFVVLRPRRGTVLADFLKVVEAVNRAGCRELAYEAVPSMPWTLQSLLEEGLSGGGAWEVGDEAWGEAFDVTWQWQQPGEGPVEFELDGLWRYRAEVCERNLEIGLNGSELELSLDQQSFGTVRPRDYVTIAADGTVYVNGEIRLQE